MKESNKKSSIEKVVVTNAVTLEALIKLLEEKGIINTAELIALIRKFNENESQIYN